MSDIDIDITQSRPLRLGVVLHDQVVWDRDSAAERIRGVDLSDIARRSARLRREHPDVDVVADIDVVIAAEARAARSMLNSDALQSCDGALLYVGTPSGLVGLITDIHALGIADGAVLIPRAAGVAGLIRDAVLPLLHTRLQLPSATHDGRPA